MKDSQHFSLTLLRRPEVEQRTGLSRSSIYKLMSNNEFPRPISLFGRTVAWLEEEVSNWIISRIAASRKETKGVQQ